MERLIVTEVVSDQRRVVFSFLPIGDTALMKEGPGSPNVDIF